MEWLAVMLRGPPGVGKSTILKCVCQLAEKAGYAVTDVNLDHFWFENSDGSKNHRLQQRQPLLLLELAWGEPPTPTFKGASLNPASWYEALKKHGRVVRVYTISCTLESAIERDQRRPYDDRVGDAEVKRLHGLYAPGADLCEKNLEKQLPSGTIREGFDTDKEDQDTIAQRIWADILLEPVKLPSGGTPSKAIATSIVTALNDSI